MNRPQGIMTQRGKTLGKAIARRPEQGIGSEIKTEIIKPPACGQKSCSTNKQKDPGLPDRELPGNQGALTGTGVGGINTHISQPIKGHGKGTDQDHGDGQKQKYPCARPALCGPKHPHVGKGKGKDRMFNFDHPRKDRGGLAQGMGP